MQACNGYGKVDLRLLDSEDEGLLLEYLRDRQKRRDIKVNIKLVQTLDNLNAHRYSQGIARSQSEKLLGGRILYRAQT